MMRKCMGACLTGLLVAGCGGGSDAPADARASSAAAQAMTLNETSLVVAASGAGAAASSVHAILDVQRGLFEQEVLGKALADILKREAEILASMREADPVTGVRDPQKVKEADDLERDKTQLVFSSGQTCRGGGSLSLTWTDVDRSKTASSGDVLQLLASDCAWYAGAGAVSGGITVDIVSLQAEANSQPTAGALRMRLAGLRVGTHSVSGDVVVDFGALQQSLSTSELSAYQGVTLVSRYQLQARADQIDGLLRLQSQIEQPLPDPALPHGATNTWVRQAIALSTDAPLRFSDGHPVQGQLRLVAGAGATTSTGTTQFTTEGASGQLIGANGASTFSTAVMPW